MFHYSLPNLSDQTGVVTVSRIFPAAGRYDYYYKEAGNDSKIEIGGVVLMISDLQAYR